MYTPSDESRFITEELSGKVEREDYRSQFRKDYARLIHCPSFRRLVGKTQLFPGKESDFFRNRLTHSLEVAQIAKSIALRINNRFLAETTYQLDTDLVEFSGLAHDLGHPPFGHQGEAALDECMLDHGGFEGNAQTLRILTRLEKKIYDEDSPEGISKNIDKRVGLNLTYRSLASIIKYDFEIPYTKKEREEYAGKLGEEKVSPVKGYYKSESEFVDKIKSSILAAPTGKLKTVECQIMDIADDIAYSTYDLEDGLKAGFYNIFDVIFVDKIVISNIALKVSQKLGKKFTEDQIRDELFEIFDVVLKPPTFGDDVEVNKETFFGHFLITAFGTYNACKSLSKNGYLRTSLTSSLVSQFIKGIRFELNTTDPKLSKVTLDDEVKLRVEVLKRFNYESQILSPRLKIVEFRGKEIVKKIFKTLNGCNGYELLPFDCRAVYESVNKDEKPRVICDYIASMTDNYCIEFYGRLTSENPETIFKPF